MAAGQTRGGAHLLPDLCQYRRTHKLRKLGQQSGAAAAFAGEPARGALIEHAGADKTTLARLSSLLEQNEEEEDAQVVLLGESESENEVAEEEAALKAVFAQRAEELRKALVRGREWLGGIQDDLAERLAVLAASPTATVSVWAARREPLGPAISRAHKAVQVEAEQQQGEGRQLEAVIPLPTVTTPVLPVCSGGVAIPGAASRVGYASASQCSNSGTSPMARGW